MRLRLKFSGGCTRKLISLLLIVGYGQVGWAANYGFTDTEGQGSDATKIAYYNTAALALSDGDAVKGFASLAGGLTMPASGTVSLTNVVAPVGGTVTFDDSTLNLTGNLHMAPASLVGGCSTTLNGGGNVIFLDEDVTFPVAQTTFILSSDLVIDGQGHTLTFDPNTTFSLQTKSLTLKNMVIQGLSNATQAQITSGTNRGHLNLQNCIIDLGSTTTWTYGGMCGTDLNLTMSVIDTVVVQGGGNFKYGSNNTSMGNLTIKPFSTLYIAPDTTFHYCCYSFGSIVMSAASSILHINGGTLKADPDLGGERASEGLVLQVGKVFLEGKVTLENGTNSLSSKSIGLGTSDVSDLTVKVFPGAYITVNGLVDVNRETVF